MGVRRGLRQKGARGLTGGSPSSLLVVFGVTGELYDVVIAVGPACAGVLDPVGVCRGHPEESRGRRDELEVGLPGTVLGRGGRLEILELLIGHRLLESAKCPEIAGRRALEASDLTCHRLGQLLHLDKGREVEAAKAGDVSHGMWAGGRKTVEDLMEGYLASRGNGCGAVLGYRGDVGDRGEVDRGEHLDGRCAQARAMRTMLRTD